MPKRRHPDGAVESGTTSVSSSKKAKRSSNGAASHKRRTQVCGVVWGVCRVSRVPVGADRVALRKEPTIFKEATSTVVSILPRSVSSVQTTTCETTHKIIVPADPEERDCIGPNGVERFCEDLGVDPEDVSLF